jgi:hypothetical protein
MLSEPQDLNLPVSFCNLPALILRSSDHHDRLVFVLVHVGKGSVTLHKHARVERHLELAAQIGHPFRLMLAAAICE